VVGQGALCDTAAFFAADPGGALAFDDGECTCPVGYNCKHVAAIVIAAIDGRGAGRAVRDRQPVRKAAPAAHPPAWDKPLRALIDAPAPPAAGNPLAMKLAFHAERRAVQLDEPPSAFTVTVSDRAGALCATRHADGLLAATDLRRRIDAIRRQHVDDQSILSWRCA
jgi:hypothetical protein